MRQPAHRSPGESTPGPLAHTPASHRRCPGCSTRPLRCGQAVTSSRGHTPGTRRAAAPTAAAPATAPGRCGERHHRHPADRAAVDAPGPGPAVTSSHRRRAVILRAAASLAWMDATRLDDLHHPAVRLVIAAIHAGRRVQLRRVAVPAMAGDRVLIGCEDISGARRYIVEGGAEATYVLLEPPRPAPRVSGAEPTPAGRHAAHPQRAVTGDVGTTTVDGLDTDDDSPLASTPLDVHDASDGWDITAGVGEP